MLERILKLEPLSARFMRKFGELGHELACALVLCAARFQEHVFGSPEKHAVNGFRRLVARKCTLVAHPERFFITALQGVCKREYLPSFDGAFLVIDIPPLYDGFYRDFFNSCTILFTVRSGAITSTVYSSCTWTKK